MLLLYNTFVNDHIFADLLYLLLLLLLLLTDSFEF